MPSLNDTTINQVMNKFTENLRKLNAIFEFCGQNYRLLSHKQFVELTTHLKSTLESLDFSDSQLEIINKNMSSFASNVAGNVAISSEGHNIVLQTGMELTGLTKLYYGTLNFKLGAFASDLIKYKIGYTEVATSDCLFKKTSLCTHEELKLSSVRPKDVCMVLRNQLLEHCSADDLVKEMTFLQDGSEAQVKLLKKQSNSLTALFTPDRATSSWTAAIKAVESKMRAMELDNSTFEEDKILLGNNCGK